MRCIVLTVSAVWDHGHEHMLINKNLQRHIRNILNLIQKQNQKLAHSLTHNILNNLLNNISTTGYLYYLHITLHNYLQTLAIYKMPIYIVLTS